MEERKRPFPTFVLWLLVFTISLLFLMVRCSSDIFAKEPPTLSVAADGAPLNWVMVRNVWNGETSAPEDPFLLYGQKIETPSHAAAGETVTVTIGGDIPDKVVLEEYALAPNGQSVYGERQLLGEYPFYFNRKSGTFTLPEPGEHPVRGYVLRCFWGENNCDYGMIVKIRPE